MEGIILPTLSRTQSQFDGCLRILRCLSVVALAGVGCGPDLVGGNSDSGDGDGDVGDGDGDGDGQVHESPCASQYEGMICIPAGPFIMGGEVGYHEELRNPEQVVELSRFHIDRHEVTFGEYRACVEAGACSPPAAEDPKDDLTRRCRWGQEGIDGVPVACVDWLQADQYCKWRGAALPTEAQWEKAGRGTDGRKYPWGDEAPTCEFASMAKVVAEWDFEQEVVWGCGKGMPEVAGAHSPQGDSPYGVQDMSGNVAEVVADWLGPGQAELGPDPTGPATGDFKVYKGGSFISGPDDSEGRLQMAWRGQGGQLIPGFQMGESIGFRCAISD